MKKHISPLQTMWALCIFSTFSFIYLSSALSFGKESFDAFAFAAASAGLACLILELVFTVLTFKRQKGVTADEFSSHILNKSGYYAFVSVAAMITFFFIAIGVKLLLSDETQSLTELLDIRVILALFAIIQLLGSVIFSLTYFILSKKGGEA